MRRAKVMPGTNGTMLARAFWPAVALALAWLMIAILLAPMAFIFSRMPVDAIAGFDPVVAPEIAKAFRSVPNTGLEKPVIGMLTSFSVGYIATVLVVAITPKTLSPMAFCATDTWVLGLV